MIYMHYLVLFSIRLRAAVHRSSTGSGQVPGGDILIHCGDMTNRGSAPELQEVNAWFEERHGAMGAPQLRWGPRWGHEIARLIETILVRICTYMIL